MATFDTWEHTCDYVLQSYLSQCLYENPDDVKEFSRRLSKRRSVPNTRTDKI